jgi:hypothetical protein
VTDSTPVAVTERTFNETVESLSSAGVTFGLRRTAEGIGGALRCDAESARGVAQLVVWDTGEADLVIGDLATGTVLLNEHRSITSALGARDAIETILSHLGTEPR